MAADDNEPSILSKLSGAGVGLTTGLVGGGIAGFASMVFITTTGGAMVLGVPGTVVGGIIGLFVGSPLGAMGGLLFGLGEALVKFDTSNILKRIDKGVVIGAITVSSVGAFGGGILAGIAGGALGAVIGLPVGVIGALDAGIRTSSSRAKLGFTQGLMASLTFNKETSAKNPSITKSAELVSKSDDPIPDAPPDTVKRSFIRPSSSRRILGVANQLPNKNTDETPIVHVQSNLTISNSKSLFQPPSTGGRVPTSEPFSPPSRKKHKSS